MTKEALLQHEATEYMTYLVITETERQELLDWVQSGRSVHDNPWYMADEHGRPMDYVRPCVKHMPIRTV